MSPKNTANRPAKGFRCGTVAILGRPNAGKSTLLNALLEVAVSATSPRPQTTRTNVKGILQIRDAKKRWIGQVVLIDTPGVNLKKGQLLERSMLMAVEEALQDVDVALWVADARGFTDDLKAIELAKVGADKIPAWLQHVLGKSKEGGAKWVLAISKADALAKPKLLPIMEKAAAVLPEFEAIIPIAAAKGMADEDSNLEGLLKIITGLMPEREPMHDEGEWTNLNERELIQNLVREQIFRFAREEVPYQTDCSITRFQEPSGRRKMPEVDATIWVGKDSLKPILVGKGGSRIKEIGETARARYKEVTGDEIVLRLFVKVVDNWHGTAKHLQELGYRVDD